MPDILLVEDDPAIIDFMKVILEKEGYHVLPVKSGTEAMKILQTDDFSVILLDLGLPDMDGLELLSRLRKHISTSIIVISARNFETEKVEALDAGADDYVTKPFGTKELLARIRAALRHQQVNNEPHPVFMNGPLRLDSRTHEFFVSNRRVHLTKNEFRLLQLLFENMGKVVTYEKLMRSLWGPYINEQRILRVNISNIRKKIEINPLTPEFILTEVGVGYRLKDYHS